MFKENRLQMRDLMKDIGRKEISHISTIYNLSSLISFDISERAEFVLAVAPVGFHLDENLEVDTLVEEFLYILASLHAHTLQHRAAAPYQYAFLAVALDIDNGHDMDRPLCRGCAPRRL